MFSISPALVGIFVVLLVLLVFVPWIFVRNYIKVPPNQVAVFTGRGKPKVVRGGARFRVPGLERVDIMSLEPFELNLRLSNALSEDGVPVNVEAKGMVRIGTADEDVQTAVQRFLTSELTDLKRQINEILEGSLRGIVATMTVENLNSNREALSLSVINEAGEALKKIGMEVDVLKIAAITDDNGYLHSLGKRRIAEVKRDAEIGTAQAERDSQIQSAKARQEGSVAQAEADTAIAAAEQQRDVKVAQLRAQTEAENAKANQAGPLAEALAKKGVGIANEEAEAARVQARVEVERQRAEQAKAALQADVIEPAEAEQKADIARAEGRRQADILSAEAEAEAARQRGSADADARKLAASALREEQQAEADGLSARLKAQADGERDLAEAFNSYSSAAAQIKNLPEILRAQVDATREAVRPLGEIGNISIIGSSDAVKGGLSSILGISPEAIAGVFEAFESRGVNITGILNGFGANQAQSMVAADGAGDDVKVFSES